MIALILAAGAARRMGQAKQRMMLGGQPMLVRAIRTAQAAGLRPLVVVGAHRQAVEAIIPPDVERVFNADWERGMGSSLVAGLRACLRERERSGVVVMVCDQPLVRADDIRALVDACDRSVDASAAAYEGILGIPACFSPACFDELLALAPHQGARRLLRSGHIRVAAVPMDHAANDVDTPADIERSKQALGDGSHRDC